MEVLVRRLANAVLLSGLTLSQASPQSRMLLATSVSPIIQNQQADEQDLSRIRDEQTLKSFVRSRILVPIPSNARAYYLKGVPARYSYARPWSKRFLDHIGGQFYNKFHERLRVTSLVRTEAFQLKLAGYNGNAAPASGPTQSSHLTGATMDISKALMSPQQRDWMRAKLVAHAESGYLYAIEEHQQPTFHIMVYKSFPQTVTAYRASTKKTAAKSAKTKMVEASRSHSAAARTTRIVKTSTRKAKARTTRAKTRRVSRRR